MMILILLLVSKCFVAPLHEPMSHESPPIIMTYDPLWIIKPANEQNLVSCLYAVEKHQADFNGFVETFSGHYPTTSQSGFVQARPQVAGAK